jgi:hypothetical protein
MLGKGWGQLIAQFHVMPRLICCLQLNNQSYFRRCCVRRRLQLLFVAQGLGANLPPWKRVLRP